MVRRCSQSQRAFGVISTLGREYGEEENYCQFWLRVSPFDSVRCSLNLLLFEPLGSFSKGWQASDSISCHFF